MSNTKKRKLTKYFVGPLPLIHHIAKQMDLRELLCQYLPTHGNELIHPADTLILLIYNLTVGKNPLYELEAWSNSRDLNCIEMTHNAKLGKFNDDRFGKALDKLYYVNRASLLTDLVMIYAKRFYLDNSRIHNDSTTVKAYGQIPGTTYTGLQLKKGHSKDHRPDLKQLVFNLSVSSDGAVPIHHKCFAGNKTDDTIHKETWSVLKKINNSADFIYVADSKVCTDKQLYYIAQQNGGTVITIIPDTWGEVKEFKTTLRNTIKTKRKIWYRVKPGTEDELEYFSVFNGQYQTKKRGYRIHWIFSSEKRGRDRLYREKRLKKIEKMLTELNARLNTGKYKSLESIKQALNTLRLTNEDGEFLIQTEINTHTESQKVQQGKGRPGKNTQYFEDKITRYSLQWWRNQAVIKKESKTDGVFPLLCTDTTFSSKKVLQAYKYQPRLEKRFEQLKTFHYIAPLLFKKIERVEANMFAFFVSLVIQALIEREVRKKMSEENIEQLNIYPEERMCKKPTAAIIFETFENVCKYEIRESTQLRETYHDELTQQQQKILKLLNITEKQYWNNL